MVLIALFSRQRVDLTKTRSQAYLVANHNISKLGADDDPNNRPNWTGAHTHPSKRISGAHL